jgi:hypothetical protein
MVPFFETSNSDDPYRLTFGTILSKLAENMVSL